MRKAGLLIAVAIPAVLAAIAAIKPFATVHSATAMQPAVVAPKPAAVTADMMAIVPAPVLDTRAGVFVGTGDSSNGVWVKP